MPTPLRSIRIDDDLWTAALRAAQAADTTVSDVVRDALREYLANEAARRRRRGPRR